MDEEWMQKFKTEYMPILAGDRHKQTISLVGLQLIIIYVKEVGYTKHHNYRKA